MSSIALMTWFQYFNYGTSLQVVALARVMGDMGHDVSVVNYRTNGKVATLLSTNPVSSAAREIKGKVEGRLLERRVSSLETDSLFSSFLNSNLSFTAACETMTDLEELNDSFDVFVCGSDQIWSPAVFDPHYYLDFADTSKLKIAYAPSVGLTEVRDSDIRQRMGELASRIDCLSTRERSGSDIIAELTGRNVEVVLDPTLLVRPDEWNTITCDAKVEQREGYLLAYMLGHNEWHWNMVYKIAEKLGLSVCVIPVFRRDLTRKGCITDPIGPCEFVKLFSGASFICTDSFHGVAFSINYEKDFCAFERFKEDDPVNQNSRVINLLDMTGLMNRLLRDRCDVATVLSPVSWPSHRARLKERRDSSLSWLKTALSSNLRACTPKRNVYRYRSLCCGCSACAAVCPVGAIEMTLDHEGFWRSRIDQGRCVSCGKCRDVCPLVERRASLALEKGRLFSYKDRNPDVLTSSSSGGAAAEIARMSFQSNAAVLGCVFDCGSHEATHVLVEPDDADALAELAGSKYMQSRMHPALEKAASYDGPLTVFGTPCQVAAARNMLSRRADVLYVDLICHGVPSRFLYDRYLDWLHREHGLNLQHTRTVFRYKPRGWRERYLFSTDGLRSVCLFQSHDPYFQLFDMGQCYGKCCYECPWRSSSAADIRLGDYWGPRFRRDKTGVSMVLAMTERGESAVKDLALSGEVLHWPLDDYISYQQVENEPAPVYRSRLLLALSNPETRIEDVAKEFAGPEASKRRILGRVAPLGRLVKRVLKGRS